MKYSEFIEQVNRIKNSDPVWFELDAEPIATQSDLEAIENQLSVSLPEEYKQFTKTFGELLIRSSIRPQWIANGE